MDYCDADDYCDVFQTENLEISETNPCRNEEDVDQFLIAFEVETTFPAAEDDDEEQFVRVDNTKIFTFWAACPRFKQHNLSRERISAMLSRAGVALHKQGFMIDIISLRADQIANAARNKASALLPMLVSISIVACSCYQDIASASVA